MEEKKDYSLLRPFDLEAAKRGETICTDEGGCIFKDFLGGPDRHGAIGLRHIEGYLLILPHAALRMAPRTWVEGKPAYDGDRVFGLLNKSMGTVQADGVAWDNGSFTNYNQPGGRDATSANVTWAPPKVKREGWLNIYPAREGCWLAKTSGIHGTKKEADDCAATGRVDCIRVEWGEPASQEGGAA